MTVIATASNPKFTVSRVDIDRPGVTYTIDTLRDIRAQHPDAELFFITGADAVAEIMQWKDADKMWDLAHFVAVPRVLIAGRGETAGRQGRYVGNTGTGDFLDRCAATCGAWGACLVPRTGRRGAIYWQARTVPVNFR